MLRRGFTILEMVLTLAALAMVLQGWYAWKAARLAEAGIERTVDGFVLIDEAAYAYHVEEGRWPNDLGELRASTPPLLPVPVGGFDPLVNGVGGPYVLAPRVGGGIEVRTEMLDDNQAASVQRAFPHRTRTEPGGVAVFEQTVAPKDQTDHELLVWRDASRDMRAPFPFAAAVSVVDGAACNGKRFGPDSAGQLFECVASVWRGVGSAFGSAAVPCGWSGDRVVVEWAVNYSDSTHCAGCPKKEGHATFWTCAGNELTNVRTGFCAYSEARFPGSQYAVRRQFVPSDCAL